MVLPREGAGLLVEEGQRPSTQLSYMINSNCTEDLNRIQNTGQLILVESLPIGLDLDFLTITTVPVDVGDQQKQKSTQLEDHIARDD